MADSDNSRSNENYFRLIVEGVKDYAIFMLDPDGNVVSWNKGAERIKGYRADEIVGRNFSCFYPAEANARGWPDYELAMARKTGRFEDDGWRVRKDGSLFWANVVITALHDADGRFRGFAKVTRDMTERKRMEELELAQRKTTRFLALLGHELRNPLTPIRNAIAVVEMAKPNLTTFGWALTIIKRQLLQLTRLVDDLLDVGRLTTGQIVLQRARLDLGGLLTEVAEAHRAAFEAKQQAFVVAMPGIAVPVMGDAVRLTQLVQNVLNNALKYTPTGGRVALTMRAEPDDTALISVRDSGKGIAPERIPHVFDLFGRADDTTIDKEGGLGVGLSLAKQLIELHGGSIEARSAGVGQGSEFVLRMPLIEAPSTESPSTDDAVPQGADPAQLAASVRRRVLVVDDNPDATETWTALLSTLGHEVRTALDGEHGLLLAAEYMPDVILLDIGMPGMDGYAVAKALRGMDGLAHVSVVAVTGYGQTEHREQSLAAGFDAHLVKPVGLEVLAQLLAKLEVPPPG